jgi:hypothetical protein
MSQKLLLICEKNKTNFNIVEKNDQEYVLEGVFTQFGVLNANQRIYEEKDFLPHLEYLQESIRENSLLGELDHPDKFDITLTNVSHRIEEMKYDKESRQIRGKIRIFNTPKGQIAKELIDKGTPIAISSRAAGVVKENNHVELKRVFTYDLVATPGFKNAKLKRINESEIGGLLESENLAIYDVSNEELFVRDAISFKIIESEENNKETPTMTKQEQNQNATSFVSEEKMSIYTKRVKDRIVDLDTRLSAFENAHGTSSLTSLQNEVHKIQSIQEKMITYLDTFHDEHKILENYVKNSSTRLDQSIDYTQTIALNAKKLEEQMKFSFSFLEKVSVTLNEALNYIEEVAGATNANINYTEEIAGAVNAAINYIEEAAGASNAAINYMEEIAGATNANINYTQEVAGAANAAINYIEEVAGVGNTGKTSSPISEKTSNLLSKVDEILNSVKKQKTEVGVNESSFGQLKLLSPELKTKFNSLSPAQKQKVVEAVNENKAFSERDIILCWNKALYEYNSNPNRFLDEMPEDIKPVWESLNNAQKQTIIAQSRFYDVQSDLGIKQFWETRELKPRANVSQLLKESAQLNNTSQSALEVSDLGYSKSYIEAVRQAFTK